MIYPVLSFFLVVLGIPLCIWLANRFGLYDEPDDERKLHHERVPYTGGLAIAGAFAAVVTVMWFVDGLDLLPSQPINYVPIYLYIVEAAFIIFMLGAVDDFKALSFTKKFVFQFLAAIFIVLGASRSGIFPEVFSPIQSSVLTNSVGTVITLLWIVGTTNAINMIDGLDGLAGGSSLLSSITMGILALLWGNSILAIVLFILAGALLGFLMYNRPPARVFMGDTGSMFTGFVLAVCGWLLLVSAPLRATSFAVPIIVLGLPVFDTLLAFARRIIAKRNPFSADTLHIHHMLQLRLELSTRHTVLILYAVTLTYCLLGVGVAFAPESVAWILLAAVAAGTILFLHFLGYTEVMRNGRAALHAQNILPFSTVPRRVSERNEPMARFSNGNGGAVHVGSNGKGGTGHAASKGKGGTGHAASKGKGTANGSALVGSPTAGSSTAGSPTVEGSTATKAVAANVTTANVTAANVTAANITAANVTAANVVAASAPATNAPVANAGAASTTAANAPAASVTVANAGAGSANAGSGAAGARTGMLPRRLRDVR